jgi:hypothetical protein
MEMPAIGSRDVLLRLQGQSPQSSQASRMQGDGTAEPRRSRSRTLDSTAAMPSRCAIPSELASPAAASSLQTLENEHLCLLRQ